MYLHLVRRASKNDPALILLHAFPFSSKMWEPLIAHLHEIDVTIVAVDLPGFGNSPGYEWTMSGLAEDLNRSLKEIGINHPILCGLSMGGYVAFTYYRQYRDSVRGLILADTKASADNEQAKADREKYALDALARGPIAAEERQLAKMTSSWTKEHAPEIASSVRHWMHEAKPQAIANALRAMAQRSDSNDLLPSMDIPTLAIVGEEDVITPLSEMRSFAEKIPSATFVTIPHAGHLSAVEQPDVFAGHVKEYFDRLA